MIDRTHALPLTQQAAVLGISRGAVYYAPRPVSPWDLAVMRRIDAVHLECPWAGARMLRRMLRQMLRPAFPRVGRRRIGTLMRPMGIVAMVPRPGTSRRPRAHPVYPYCFATGASRARTRGGRWTLPTSRWRVASSMAHAQVRGGQPARLRLGVGRHGRPRALPHALQHPPSALESRRSHARRGLPLPAAARRGRVPRPPIHLSEPLTRYRKAEPLLYPTSPITNALLDGTPSRAILTPRIRATRAMFSSAGTAIACETAL